MTRFSDVQVIGVPDKRYGEEIMACIILKDGAEDDRGGNARVYHRAYGAP